MKKTFWMGALVLAAMVARAATNDLTTALQRGLFEEEANRNLEAAIQAYQSVANQFDKDRKLAATAIFRLGECYRKQGNTNGAVAQFERVVREFSDQSALATLSRQNLAGLGSTATVTESASTAPKPAASELTNTETEEVKRIQALIKDSPDLINAHQLGGTTPLHGAAAAGQLVVARFLLANGADTEAKDTQSGGRTPLHYAANAGHKAMVELLLSKQANVLATDKDGLTPLHLAAENGYRSVVESLLEHGALVNATNRYGSTPLVLAASNGFKAVIDLLLAHGADLNAVAGSQGNRFQSGTALCVAAQRSDYSLAEFLLAKGATVNIVSKEGRTALSFAADRQDERLVKLLLAAHADPNAGTRYLPLASAAYYGDLNTLQPLLAAGANPNATNQVGRSITLNGARAADFPDGRFSPIFLAVNQHHPQAVTALLQAKADPNGPGLLFEALPDDPTLQALLEGGADPNPRDSEGRTPLQRVVANQPTTVALLLAHGADPNAASVKGWTPLHEVTNKGNTNTMALLLNKGAEVNARTAIEGYTPLWVAVHRDDAAAVKLLLDHKADPNVRDNAGTTVLAYAKSREPRLLPSPGTIPSPAVSRPMRLPPGTLPASSATASAAPPVSIVALLRQYGALDHLPHPDAIELRRSAANFSITLFHKDTNDWNHFTLLELLAVEYRFLSSNPDGQARLQEDMRSLAHNNAFHLNYPDLGHVRIRRLAPDLKSMTEKTVDAGALLKSGDCSQDLPLQWGDMVEIPEADHPLNERWSGFSAREAKTFQDCLSRQVEIVIKGHTTRLTLGPQLDSTADNLYTKASLWLKPVLRSSNLLLVSSDLARVKVTRTDPATGQKQQWVVDCTDSESAPDLWLRNGDVIEVPEKGEGYGAAEPPAKR